MFAFLSCQLKELTYDKGLLKVARVVKLSRTSAVAQPFEAGKIFSMGFQTC